MLKRLLVFLVFCGIAYSCYFDWKVGTLPAQAEASSEKVTQVNNTTMPSAKVIVRNGETVLSIVEKVNDGSVPSSISQIISDFEALNPNVKAHVIKAGIEYFFPIYKQAQ